MSYSTKAELWIKHARSDNRFYNLLERPAMRSLLPADLSGQSVLCLGVGSGEETALYEQLRAERVVGIDSSPQLIASAKHRFPQHQFLVGDLTDTALAEGQFHLVVSSMAVHYLPDWRLLLKNVYASLRAGGLFVFSTHNPVWWSAEKVKLADGFEWVIGVKTNTKNHSQQVLGKYLSSVKLKQEIFKGFEVEFYHRPFSLLINDIIASEFQLKAVLEPKPIDSAKQSDPEFYRRYQQISSIVLFKLRKD